MQSQDAGILVSEPVLVASLCTQHLAEKHVTACSQLFIHSHEQQQCTPQWRDVSLLWSISERLPEIPPTGEGDGPFPVTLCLEKSTATLPDKHST